MDKSKQSLMFWKAKPMEELSNTQWESLCDGCARCCLQKLEDEDTGDLYYTDVVCELLDQETCKCSDYENRLTRVPDCIQVTPENAGALEWMPESCGYRKLGEGHELSEWHPLVSGSDQSVHEYNISVRGKVVSDADVAEEDYEDHIVDWPNIDETVVERSVEITVDEELVETQQNHD